jgi:putative phosphoribosyl transferase
LEDFRTVADQIVCLATPEPFEAVGHFYADFLPTSDAEVIHLMQNNALAHATAPVVAGAHHTA